MVRRAGQSKQPKTLASNSENLTLGETQGYKQTFTAPMILSIDLPSGRHEAIPEEAPPLVASNSYTKVIELNPPCSACRPCQVDLHLKS